MEKEVTLYKDRLTGVYNREGFCRAADQELDRASHDEHPVTVAYLDLECSETAVENRTGEVILQSVARTLEHSLRKTDVVARWDSDEFLVLLPGAGPESAMAVIHKLQDDLTRITAQEKCPVTVRIGAITYLAAPGSVDSMLHGVEIHKRSPKVSGETRIRHQLVP